MRGIDKHSSRRLGKPAVKAKGNRGDGESTCEIPLERRNGRYMYIEQRQRAAAASIVVSGPG